MLAKRGSSKSAGVDKSLRARRAGQARGLTRPAAKVSAPLPRT
jgi:hypothetical protein